MKSKSTAEKIASAITNVCTATGAIVIAMKIGDIAAKLIKSSYKVVKPCTFFINNDNCILYKGRR